MQPNPTSRPFMRTTTLPTTEDMAEPKLVQRLMLVTSAGITLLLVWASLAKLDDIARAGGIIVAHGNNAVVQHRDGGTLQEIYVREGQTVESGQALLKLNDTDIEADTATILQRMDFLKAQVKRLGYVLNLPQNIPVAGSLPTMSMLLPPPAVDIAAFEDISTIEPAAGNGSEFVPTDDPQAVSLMERRRTLRSGLMLAHQEYRRQLDLRQQGYSTQSRVYAAERDMQAQSQSLAAFEADLAAQYSSAISEYQQQDEQLKKLSSRATNTIVRAPIAGTVQSLRLNTAGATVPAGTTLMELVPAGATLEAQLRLSPSHIGMVKVGQPAHVRITAFESSHYGTLEGTVSQISADAVSDESGRPTYQVWVRIPQTLQGARGSQSIKPGMVVVAGVVTGRHSIMDYLLRPIRNALDDLSPSA